MRIWASAECDAAVNIVIHAAANTSFSKSSDHRAEQVNIGGTCQLVEWARRLGQLHVFVYVGTAASCGTAISRRVVHEDETPSAGARHAVKYSYAKMIGETLVRQAFPVELGQLFDLSSCHLVTR
jgi:nucleoside-diphosphate-sugar epimerase